MSKQYIQEHPTAVPFAVGGAVLIVLLSVVYGGQLKSSAAASTTETINYSCEADTENISGIPQAFLKDGSIEYSVENGYLQAYGTCERWVDCVVSTYPDFTCEDHDPPGSLAEGSEYDCDDVTFERSYVGPSPESNNSREIRYSAVKILPSSAPENYTITEDDKAFLTRRLNGRCNASLFIAASPAPSASPDGDTYYYYDELCEGASIPDEANDEIITITSGSKSVQCEVESSSPEPSASASPSESSSPEPSASPSPSESVSPEPSPSE